MSSDPPTLPPSTMPQQEGGSKIKRALLKVARPVRSNSQKSGKGTRTQPELDEGPAALLRVHLESAKGVHAKDRNGLSDPFAVVSVGLGKEKKERTNVVKKSVDPVWNESFEFPIYASLADRTAIETVLWDKDMIKKDYLGEVYVPLEEWFTSDALERTISLPISSTRASLPGQGTLTLRLTLLPPPNQQEWNGKRVYAELVKRSRKARPSLVNAPPTRGIGTVRRKQTGDQGGVVPAAQANNDSMFQDDGGISSDELDSDSDGEYDTMDESDTTDDDEDITTTGLSAPGLTISPASPIADETPKASPIPGVVSPTTPTPLSTPYPEKEKKSKLGRLSGRLSRKSSSKELSSSSSSGIVTPGEENQSSPEEKRRKLGFGIRSRPSSTASVSAPPSAPGTPGVDTEEGPKKHKKTKSTGFTLDSEASNDIVGICLLEIVKADELPRLKNMTRTGWDMDPFVVVSFGKKVFRTRVIRHSRNPQWDEKLLFHVRKYETGFNISFSILDWDKMSSNDHIGDALLPITELVKSAAQPDPKTGLYPAEELRTDGSGQMKEFTLTLSGSGGWEDKWKPSLTFRAKYQPYAALRQKFWRQYLEQYDADDGGSMSRLEIMSMLDSLGSTLSKSTVESWWTKLGKDPHKDDLTMDEAVLCLEHELMRPESEKKPLSSTSGDAKGDDEDTSVAVTPITAEFDAAPVVSVVDNRGREVNVGAAGPGKTSKDGGQLEFELDHMDFSGPPISVGEGTAAHGDGAEARYGTEGMQVPLQEAAAPLSSSEDSPVSSSSDVQPGTGKKSKSRKFRKGKSKAKKLVSSASDPQVERVINIKNCPLCHRPRLNSKAEVDIITHLAVCASQDWGKVDRILSGNYVTASQAQRKWYTKVLGKVSGGDYKLGANSANIIVQNRLTGQLEEEKMQVYVRLGIRLLYKGMKSRMEGGRARKLLKSLSVKQGIKYDDPESANDIPAFIEFHGLNVDEILDPLDSFKNFNQFFYRKLKPSARPVEEPDNPYRIVSAADCRFLSFSTVSEATSIWIKGREFTIPRLLGEAYKDDWGRYSDGGALAIFRLAPQDYHRFHTPVDGKIGKMTYIEGEYYTVNPQAIRTALDVYGENARKIVPIDSPQFGRVMAVCVGAMMVGTIVTTVEEGQEVKRGDEFGYFAFGGSTIVLLIEKGALQWDEDLLINSRASLETLVRVGMGLGRGTRGP